LCRRRSSSCSQGSRWCSRAAGASDQLWILIGLAGIAFSIVTGAGFIGPESGRLQALLETRTFEDPEVQSRLNRIFKISRIELGVLLLIVIDMAIKPGA
jgi:hypothetical protein